MPHQGRLLLGFKDPDVRTFSFPSLTGVTVGDDGELVAVGLSGTDFTGAKLTASGTTTVDMRIAEVVPPAAPDGKWQYVLEQQDPNGTWAPACDTPTQLLPPIDPPATPPRAIAMSGRWLPDGLYQVSASAVTFACETGVVAKCDSWGYPVTADPPNVTENGMSTSASGADLMQACTRMARADYCSTGLPNTLDGTPIHIDDVFTEVPPEPGFAFEAAWTGVAIADRRIVRPPVVCLSKLRWSTLPLGGNCSLQLPDPRVDSKGTFCEDMPPKLLEDKGALLYSSSAFIDAGLYTHTDPATQLRFTTASLLPEAAGLLPAWQIPDPGIDFPAAGQSVRFEATIFAAALPLRIPDTQLVELHSYRCDDDLITSTTQPRDPSCAPIALEGHVYPPGTPGRAPLRRWRDPATKHSHTTATAPSTMIDAGWNLEEVVGGVIRAAIDVNVRWSALGGFSYTLDVQTRSGEWIASCVDSAHIGAIASFVYRGVCVGAANRAVDHADITAFRVRYTQAGQLFVATQAYDGVASDAYVALDDGQTTAIAVTWNDLGPGTSYALDVVTSNDWVRCADPHQLASDLSYVHTGRCASTGTIAKISTITRLRVCGLDAGGKEFACSEVDYDGRSPRVKLFIDGAIF